MTFKALLDGVPNSDPVLLLGVLDAELEELDPDVEKWFGLGKEGKIELSEPTSVHFLCQK